MRCKSEAVEYVHLLFSRHQIIFAEGAPTESLLLGPEALRMLPVVAQEEIEELFPKAAELASMAVPARMIPQRRWQKTLIARSKAAALLPLGFRRARTRALG